MKKGLVREFNRIFYEAEAGIYDARHPEIIEGDRGWWDEAVRKYVRPIDQREGLRIVDIGSGTGFVGEVLSSYLSERDHLICYDLSPEMLVQSRQKLNNSSRCRLNFINGEASLLPFCSNSFDLITINSLLHHLQDCRSLFGELSRLLKKGGYIMVSHEPNKLYFASAFRRFAASAYKFLGGGKSITTQLQQRINQGLKSHNLTNQELSKEEILKVVEYQSPVEQATFRVRKDKGFVPRELAREYFPEYKLLELCEYSTFFVRPLFKKSPWLGNLVKHAGSFLFGRGNLFSLILQK
jgi:ubiquinone/menaquinone biosynthesis C-methylase UbiE